MKVSFAYEAALPGFFIIEAETKEECYILRSYYRNFENEEGGKLFMSPVGGNTQENRAHIQFGMKGKD